MITYRDMEFCYSDCTRTACARHRSHVPYNAVASWADLSQECPDYTEEAPHEENPAAGTRATQA